MQIGSTKIHSPKSSFDKLRMTTLFISSLPSNHYPIAEVTNFLSHSWCLLCLVFSTFLEKSFIAAVVTIAPATYNPTVIILVDSVRLLCFSSKPNGPGKLTAPIPATKPRAALRHQMFFSFPTPAKE
jgi:hypothetical protein